MRVKTLVFSSDAEKIRALLKPHLFFEFVSEHPELVVSHGGDGTLMKAEAAYPGVPKLYLRNSYVGKLARMDKTNEELIQAVADGRYRVEEHVKLEAETKGKKIVALNDIVIHNADPRHAIRYVVTIDGVPLGHEIIGDGVVLATPLGSTGYYRSITDSSFELGIGLAFNNSTEQSDHIVLKEERVVEIRIVRGPAVAYADNQDERVELEDGDTVRIKRSRAVARIVVVS